MFASKVTVSEETKNKNEMSVREKGKVLFARLEELDKDGTLSKAQTRADVARLVGYSRERAKAGYAWVPNLIRREHLTETIRGHTPSGIAVCEYHLAGTRPDYGYEERARRRAKKETGAGLCRWQDKVAAGYIPQAPTIEHATISTPLKIEISKGDIIIKVETKDYEQTGKLIKQVLSN